MLTSALSETFLRKLAKQGFIKYTEGSEFVDTREDLIEMGDPSGGGLKEMDDKLKGYLANLDTLFVSMLRKGRQIENLRDMVLYRHGSTGVVQLLSRAGDLLGLVPVFPVRNVNTFSSGSTHSNAV